MFGKYSRLIEIQFNLVFEKTKIVNAWIKMLRIYYIQRSFAKFLFLLSKTMKITTQRYYDFVCFLYVYENLSVTLGVEQRLRALRIGC